MVVMLDEMLRQLESDFIVPLDGHHVKSTCVNLSELEHYVYQEISDFRMRADTKEKFCTSILNRINRVAKGHLSSPLTHNDMDTDLVVLAQQRMTDRWEQTYYQVGRVINMHGFRIEYPKWTEIASNCVFFGFIAAAVVMWVKFGFGLGILSLIGAFVLSSIVTQWFPYKAATGSATLRFAIDNYINEIENHTADVSLWDVQIRVRKLYAECWDIDPDEVNGNSLLTPDE